MQSRKSVCIKLRAEVFQKARGNVRKVFVVCVALLALLAMQGEARAEVLEVYQISLNDTLSEIAEDKCGGASRYLLLAQANQIKGPEYMIYAGETINLACDHASVPAVAESATTTPELPSLLITSAAFAPAIVIQVAEEMSEEELESETAAEVVVEIPVEETIVVEVPRASENVVKKRSLLSRVFRMTVKYGMPVTFGVIGVTSGGAAWAVPTAIQYTSRYIAHRAREKAQEKYNQAAELTRQAD